MGLEALYKMNPSGVYRRKFRWMFYIDGVSSDNGTNMLPPSKAARPSISFKEMEVRHLDEVVYYPGRPDWKTINLTLYHQGCATEDPVFKWMNSIYDPTGNDLGRDDVFIAPLDEGFVKRTARCEMYDGCGEKIETWWYESVWPTSIDWGDLDMESSDLVYIDLTLRYARAYVLPGNL